MKRFATAWVLWLLAPAAFAAARPETPGDEPVETPPPSLESWIPPVSGQEYVVSHHLEITPALGLSFNDPFLEKFIPQLSIGYHISEQFYVGVKGGYGFSTFAGNVNACQAGGSPCGAPNSQQQQQLPGGVTALGFVEGGWAPFYGKVNLLGLWVFHYDFQILLGLGGLLAQLPSTPSSVTPAFPAQSALSFAMAPGIGEHFFLTEHIAIAAELRDYVYFVTTGPKSQQGGQNQLMFNFGLAFLLGSKG